MNILIIGKPSNNLIALIKCSKYADKIYTASNVDKTDFPNIEYRNFDELINKAEALKIDIAININKTNISMGIAEIFAKSKINLISVNKKWLNLETSRQSAKQLLNYYKINNPKIIQVPLSFPICMITDSPNKDYKITAMAELVKKMEEHEGQKFYFEEFVDGITTELFIIWDKKNIKYFCKEECMTEVQLDRLDLLKTKLNFMFSDEKADFIGIFGIKLIWWKNDWYVISFDMGAEIPADCLKGTDFLYVLNAAIYQKLGERQIKT